MGGCAGETVGRDTMIGLSEMISVPHGRLGSSWHEDSSTSTRTRTIENYFRLDVPFMLLSLS
jgi:hypothetical protein